MYDFQAPKSIICGELAKKIEEYLLHPALPMRILECRASYAANVMAVTAWDHMGRWKKRNKLEEGFEDGASIVIELSNGEKVPGSRGSVYVEATTVMVLRASVKLTA